MYHFWLSSFVDHKLQSNEHFYLKYFLLYGGIDAGAAVATAAATAAAAVAILENDQAWNVCRKIISKKFITICHCSFIKYENNNFFFQVFKCCFLYTPLRPGVAKKEKKKKSKKTREREKKTQIDWLSSNCEGETLCQLDTVSWLSEGWRISTLSFNKFWIKIALNWENSVIGRNDSVLLNLNEFSIETNNWLPIIIDTYSWSSYGKMTEFSNIRWKWRN